MIELFAIIALAVNNGKICRRKGYRAAGYQILTVFLWIIFELAGAFIGAVIAGQTLFLYVFALSGAVIGAWLSYFIVKSLKDKAFVDDKDHIILDQNL